MEKKRRLVEVIKETCRQEMYSIKKEEYGEKYRDHLLEQYKIYVDSLKHTGDLRHKLNSYFLTLNTLLLTAIGASLYREAIFIKGNAGVAIPFVGVIICVIWWAITFSYKQRSIVKLNIIQCIENNLPLAPYKIEWDILRNKQKETGKYFFKMSLLIPWVFVLLYVFLIFFSF